MIVCQENHCHMIKLDGSLWHGSSYMIPELEKQGWRQVINPKRNYYFEFDTTHPSYKDREKIGIEDTTEILQVEIV